MGYWKININCENVEFFFKSKNNSHGNLKYNGLVDDGLFASEERISDMKYPPKEVTQKETWISKETGNKEWEGPTDLQ